jgi:adenylate cyclase class IV
MLEVEVKGVVPDRDAAIARLERAGATRTFAGRLEDRRYDFADHALRSRDNVLRVRAYRDASGNVVRASIDWKGPTRYAGGYKQREELSASLGSANDLPAILAHLGFIVTMAIDREIVQFAHEGATIRFERYPRMDDLVEVEGSTESIERAIASLGISREQFTSERLPAFVARFEQRTGHRAALSEAELSGDIVFERESA